MRILGLIPLTLALAGCLQNSRTQNLNEVAGTAPNYENALAGNCDGGLFYDTIDSAQSLLTAPEIELRLPAFYFTDVEIAPLRQLNGSDPQNDLLIYFQNLAALYQQTCIISDGMPDSNVALLQQQSFRLTSDENYLSSGLYKYISLASDEVESLFQTQSDYSLDEHINTLNPITIDAFEQIKTKFGITSFENKIADVIDIDEHNIHHLTFLGTLKTETAINNHNTLGYRDGMKLLFKIKNHIRKSLQSSIKTHSTFHMLFGDYRSFEVYISNKLARYSRYKPVESEESGFWQAHYDEIFEPSAQHNHRQNQYGMIERSMLLTSAYPKIELNPYLWSRYHITRIENARFLIKEDIGNFRKYTNEKDPNLPTCKAIESLQILEWVHGALEDYDDVREWC